MVPESIRKAGPFEGVGQKEFDFDFYMLSADDVVVTVADSEDVEQILSKDQYVCNLYADQDSAPGGKVTLTKGLKSGEKLVISSGVPNTQNLNLTMYGSFNPLSINKEEDRRVIQIQQIAEQMRRCLIVPITSSKTPQEVMTELLDVASKAQEYARRAEEIYNEVKATGDYVSSTWQQIANTKAQIDINKAAIDAALARSEEILARNEVIGEKADALYPHIDDLEANAKHIDEIHKVGQDLMTTESGSIDLGSITDTEVDTASTVVGGYIKKVAEHLDESDGCIHKVGDHIEDVEAVAENEEGIRVIASDLQGKTTQSPTLDLGLITEDTEDYEQTTVEGGYIKKVAEHIDCCIHPVSEHLDEIVRAPEYAESASKDAAVATEASASAQKSAEESEAILNRLIDVESSDFVKAFEDALAGNTSASGASDFVEIFETALYAN